MSIPEKCTVLVIGGGPGGSYTASVLAREGIDVVLLEADHFPRYHVGESMLPSFRHYLRFIDLDSTFDKYGFTRKVGAAFKLSPSHAEGYTDFVMTGGPQNYAWNVIRSEADEIMLRHAGKSGAQIFEGVKVKSVEFAASNGTANGTSDSQSAHLHLGRPISASYTRKEDGLSGVIKFDYIVDASGRVGLLNTKYLKNRHYNQGLKNVANWAYWKGTGKYSPGTKRENAPYFEALRDESGWAWFIPLHDGTTSVGVVQNQELAKEAKAAASTPKEYYDNVLKLSPILSTLLGEGELVTEIRSASDYSYNSTSYAFPYARIVGDAGCFIDPFFSSGAHIALTGGLSAATSIAAAIRGDCTEEVAAEWHSSKITESYARFLLTVLTAYKQIRNQQAYVLSDFGETDFDRAFDFFKPIIQGTADATNRLTQTEFSNAIEHITQALFRKDAETGAPVSATSPEDQAILDEIRKRQMQHLNSVEDFTTDVIDGRVPRLQRGSLGLVALEA